MKRALLVALLLAPASAGAAKRCALVVASQPEPEPAVLDAARRSVGDRCRFVDDAATRGALERFDRPPPPEDRVRDALVRAHARMRRFDAAGVHEALDEARAAATHLPPTTNPTDAGAPDGGVAPLSEQCISFQVSGNIPPMYRLADLFDIGAGSARPISLGRDPRVPFVVEIALYAPGSRPCEDNQPLVGLGRSGVVDLRSDSGPVTVPIGCRVACETHSNVKAQLLSIEDLVTDVGTPPDLALGEIFPYELFTATAGVCTTPPLTAHRGEFRPFALTHSGANLDGVWVVDQSWFDGCIAIAATTNGGRQYSCLFDENTSNSVLQGFVVNEAHLSAVRAFNDSVHARLGALVIRVIDPRDGDPNGSAIGARVSYGLLSTLSEAEYPTDDTWTISGPNVGGTTPDGLGVAVIADAATGPYVITFSDGSSRVVNAGGADDPTSVTTLVATAPQQLMSLPPAAQRLRPNAPPLLR